MISKSPNQDGSKNRRLSHSPVSVNTTYELSEHNTDKLWGKFQSQLKTGNSQQRQTSNDNQSKYQSSANTYSNINNSRTR